MKDRMFEFLVDSKYKGEFKKGDKCYLLGFTYQEQPIAWCANVKTGIVCGTNTSNIKMIISNKEK